MEGPALAARRAALCGRLGPSASRLGRRAARDGSTAALALLRSGLASDKAPSDSDSDGASASSGWLLPLAGDSAAAAAWAAAGAATPARLLPPLSGPRRSRSGGGWCRGSTSGTATALAGLLPERPGGADGRGSVDGRGSRASAGAAARAPPPPPLAALERLPAAATGEATPEEAPLLWVAEGGDIS